MTLRLLSAIAVSFVLLTGCQSQSSSGHAGVVKVKELHLEFRVPKELPGVTYAMAQSGEGQPTANFSSKSLTALGGRGCAAGATGSVSPYPLGQIILSEEPPDKVAVEAKKEPEANLGEFVTAVGDKYVYYVAPPDEYCAHGNQKAGDLQRRQTTLLKEALRTARPSA